jgi:hypothetical protein
MEFVCRTKPLSFEKKVPALTFGVSILLVTTHFRSIYRNRGYGSGRAVKH